MAEPTTRHLTILLTDIKGFTDKTSSKSRAAISTMLDEHRAVVLPLLEARGGHLVKTIGDAFLMTFESPTNAVLAGVDVQEALAKLNEGRAADDRLEIRIAINSGEVNLMENDVFGEAVNITARIESIAEAGQVYFTEAVYLAMNKAEVPSSEIGLMQLKGIPEKIRVYKVRREEPVGAATAAAVRSRLFGFLPPPPPSPVHASSEKASLAGAGVPSTWRRFWALALDGVFCMMLASAITGGGATVRAKKKMGSSNVAVSVKGLDIKTDEAAVLYDDEKGLRVTLDEDGGGRNGGRDWIFALVWFVYNLVFLKKLGTTPGKRLLKLKVVSVDGRPLDNRQRLTRASISLLSGYAAGLGYLWALWEPQRRGWHDLMADTRVVADE
ncbi:MAG: RDD family protein [Elusimicrobiota bacterium]|nr:RDD family protein [Elusimicrobiota bacterium]